MDQGPNSVNNFSLATEFSRVTEMSLFHALDVVVLEAAPKRSDP